MMVNDPRITMEQAGKGLMMFGDILRNTEGGRQLMVVTQTAMFLREWERDRSIWRRIRDRVVDWMIGHV